LEATSPSSSPTFGGFHPPLVDVDMAFLERDPFCGLFVYFGTKIYFYFIVTWRMFHFLLEFRVLGDYLILF
jgi:hypothetical protein